MVTAGGTREPIDAVRFIGNRSSGRMGMALAAAAARRGAEVTLIAANVALPEPAGVKRVDVETTAELAYETVERFETQHVLLMAAAPADFRTEPITGKIKRQDSLNLNLQPTEDILAAIAARTRQGQTVVGFAAEHGGDAVARARAKLERKGADLIVLNDVSDPTIGFESAENEVTLVAAEDEIEVPKGGQGRRRRGDPGPGRAPPRRRAGRQANPQTRRFRRMRGPAILASSFSVPICIAQFEKWAWPTFFTARTGPHGVKSRPHE